MAYEVTTFDVCMPGFERLRNRDEFILVASVWYGMSKDDLLEQFNSDIQACERPDDFDYDAVRKLVTETVANARTVDVLLHYIDIEQEMEGCNAYLFIRDTNTD